MKFYKTYESYNSTISKENWNLKSSIIGKFFGSVFRGISKTKKKYNLNVLSIEYDNYLTAVYNKYLESGYIDTNDDLDSDIIPYDKVNNKHTYKEGIDPVLDLDDNPIVPKGISDDLKKEIDRETKSDIVDNTEVGKTIKPESNQNSDLDDIKYQKEVIEEIFERIKELEKQQVVDEDKYKYGGNEKTKEDALIRIKLRKKEIDVTQSDYKTAKIELQTMLSLIESNSNDMKWAATEIYDKNWTQIDIDNVTKMVNPYQVDEFFMKASNIISSMDDTKSNKKLTNYWNLNINSVHKRWFYIFDTTSLQSKMTPIHKKSNNSNKSNTNKKEVGNNITKSKLDNLKSTQSLTEIFGSQTQSYNSPWFSRIEKDNNEFFIMTIGMNRIFLLKKYYLGKDGKMLFKMIAEMTINKDGEFVIDIEYDDIDDIKVKKIPIVLYREPNDNYPYILFKRDIVYSIETWKYSNMSDYSLTSIDDEALRRIIKNNKPNYDESTELDISEEKLSEVKNKKLN